jgi:hypothetical protein
MAIAHSHEQVTALAASALLLLTLSLGGCATSTASSSPLDARAEVSPPPKTSGYPSVEDLPQGREGMTADERTKLKNELTAARDRQAAPVKVQGSAAPAKPVKPRAVQPTDQATQR